MKKIFKINPRLIFIIAGLFLVYQMIMGINLALKDSQTTDEGVHLLAGYTYLTRHDFRFNPEHPPIVKILAALPLLFQHPNLASNYYWDKAVNFLYDSWWENRRFGDLTLYHSGNNPTQIIFYSRLSMILLTFLLGLSIFLISRKFWGALPALFSLGVYTFDPSFIGHGHLITTDIGVTLGILLSVYTFYNFLTEATWRNTIYFALAFSLALLTKFTSIILIPAFIIYLIFYLTQNRKQTKQILQKLFVAIIIIWAIIFCIYGCSYHLPPKTHYLVQELRQTNPITNKPEKILTNNTINIINSVYTFSRPIMIPREFFKGLIMLITHTQGGHKAYFLGQVSEKGWWYYFPILFLIKTPIPTLLFILFGVTFALFKKRPEINFFIFCALIFFAFAIESKADLGFRHIFPIFPLLYVVSAALLTIKKNYIYYLASLVIGLLILIQIQTYPYYLSYFNEFAHGTYNGYKLVADSNIDWGQDLYRIKNYLNQHPEIQNDCIGYNWDSKESVKYYQLDKTNSIVNNDIDYYIIGSSALDSPKFNWLRQKPIFDRITPSVFVYKLQGYKCDQ